MTIKTAGFLFDLRMRGVLARLYMLERVEPDEHMMAILCDEAELKIRDVAEAAYELGYHVELTFALPTDRDDVTENCEPEENMDHE